MGNGRAGFVQSQTGLEQLQYWKTKLAGDLPSLALPIDQPRPLVQTYRGATYRASLTSDPEVLRAIEDLASAADTTVEVVTLATLRLLLHFYTGQDDVIIGATVKTSGDSLNSVAIRCSVGACEPFKHTLSVVAKSHREAERHGDYPFPLLMEHLEINRESVFQCTFGYVDSEPGDDSAAEQQEGQYEIALRVVRLKTELLIIFHYNADLFAERTVARLADVYVQLARQVAANPAASISELEVVPESHREELLGTFNATSFSANDVSDETTIDDLFVACVRQLPHKRAVTCQGRSLTYAELDRRVDAVARSLVLEGLSVGEPVAIQLQPSVETMIAMLGALRAGATYLPIDADLPVDRVRYLLDDSGARFLIGAGRARDALAFGGRFIDLDQIDPDAGARVALPGVRSRDGAYLIYTSGTTGNPKGVLIEHHSLVNYVSWFRHRYGIDSSHTAALLTSYAFDLGYTTLWTTILSGGELHFVPESLRNDVSAVSSYFRKHSVTFIKVTPSLLSALVSSSEFNRENCGSLRLIVTGGEVVRASDLETIYARCPDALVVNHYGPTETTIGVMTYPVERAILGEFSRRPVIGRPIGNAKAYVTTPSLKLLPVGAPGELLISGHGVGRGYHRRAELTREKFIPDPFDPSSTVYRTGDLARWTQDGTIEFLGRLDRQIKIRGYRVELSEIEQVMLRRLGISEVVVVDKLLGESNRALCAYYVGETRLDPSAIRANLCEVLPEYMVPAYCIKLASIPRSANGKLDVRALPEPSFESEGPPKDPPRNETERTLLRMWSDLLGVDAGAMGVSQNFFELGGHSLLMIQLIAEIDEHFGRTVPIPVFYGEGTISALAKVLDGGAS